MRATLLLLALAACAAPGGAPVPEGQLVRTGTVRVVGSAPFNISVALTERRGGSSYLVGPLVPELANASGATVRVTGEMEGPYLRATDYVVELVDGRPVQMGVVERGEDGAVRLRDASGEAIPLIGAADRLPVGGKVWVQGPKEAGGAVRVQSYGILAGGPGGQLRPRT